MRTVITVFLSFCFASSAFAQKSIEKSIAYNGQRIEFDMKFTQKIRLKVWDKPTIYVKGRVSTLENTYLDLYKLEVDENASQIKITSNPEAIFNRFNEDHKRDKNNYSSDAYAYTEEYTLYIPQKTIAKISSISGDLQADLVDGEFTADLISGNIEIARYTGKLDLNTISGTIDLKVTNAKLNAETVLGEIYADEELSSFNRTNQLVGLEISGSFDAAENSLKLKTVNGNIYLRK